MNSTTTPSRRRRAVRYLQNGYYLFKVQFRDRDSENAHLCLKCRALLSLDCYQFENCYKTSDHRRHTRYYNTTNSLNITALDGCPICQRLWRQTDKRMQKALCSEPILVSTQMASIAHSYKLEHEINEPPTFYLNITRDGRNFEDGNTFGSNHQLHLYPKSSKSIFPDVYANYGLAERSGSLELVDFVNHTMIDGSTNSKSTWTLVSRWIGNCNTTHGQCASMNKDASRLPSRVIGLMPGQPLRLIITNDSTPAARYTTLSHCWGKIMPLRLLLDNIADFQKEIPFQSLVQTFQDAIYTSRRLGIFYLWIDSLCIIQDSKQDWEEQSAQMAPIYSNSYCNISAAHASDGTVGCFVARSPSFVTPLEVDMNWGFDPGAKYLLEPNYWNQNVIQAPLNLRAWVFQERTLSPRNLIFGATEVFFECNECRVSETFPSQIPPEIFDIDSVRQIQPHVDGPRVRQSLHLEMDPSLDAITVWGELVQRFSRLQLTYLSDKLIALSAIAFQMQKHIRSDYFAGLWRSHLPYQLLWKVQEPHPLILSIPPTQYIAPSWSWASIDGEVSSTSRIAWADDREIIVEIIDVQVELLNVANPFGQLKSGFLHMMGYLAKSVYRHTTTTVNRSVGMSIEGFLELILNGPSIQTYWIQFDFEAWQTPEGQCFYLLPIRVPLILSDRGPGSSNDFVEGIILRRIDPSKQGYVRVGKFHHVLTQLQSACRKFAEDAGNGEQENEGWGPRHLITIF